MSEVTISGHFDAEPSERVRRIANVLLPLARVAEPLEINAHAVAEHYAYAVIQAWGDAGG